MLRRTARLRRGVLICTAIGVTVLVGGGAAARASNERHASDPSVAAALNDGEPAGTGILILDPRDPLPLVRGRFRDLLSSIGGGFAAEDREAEIEAEIDALLDGDLSAPLPDLVFSPGVGV